jgi:tetratricopeptide (TPR) repeat protein
MNSKILVSSLFLVFAVASLSYGDDLCKEYSTKGQYDKAIDACTAAIGSPDSVAYLAYDNRGFAYLQKGHFDKAIADFTKAIEMKPTEAYAYNYRGLSYYKQAQYDKAIADFNTAIKLEPKNDLSYRSRAFAYEGKKQFNKAIEDWGKAIELAPIEFNYINRARLYHNEGRYDEAIADYSSLIKQNPNKAAGYLFRGAVYYEKGSFAEDVQNYGALIDIFTVNYPDAKLDLLYIRLLNASGKISRDEYDKVLKELREYVASTAVAAVNEMWWRTISKYYLGMDGMSDSKLIDEARNGRDDKSRRERLCDAYYSIGEKKLIEGDRNAAKEAFSKCIETDLSSFSYRYAKAMLRLMQEGKI